MTIEVLSKWTIVKAINNRPALIPPLKCYLGSVTGFQPSSELDFVGPRTQHGG
jgi:hypothetical protein